jgi:hypothetical protein
MAEVLVKFDSLLEGPDDRSYQARACGRQMANDERWEGWLEFVPTDGKPALRTPQETVQHDREQLRYWAEGLTPVYLAGALERALDPRPAVLVETPLRPTYDEPAPPVVHIAAERPPATTQPDAILDPFHVHSLQGEDLLRKELAALDPTHLRQIIRAYDLVDEEALDLMKMSRASLGDLIVAAVRQRVK